MVRYLFFNGNLNNMDGEKMFKLSIEDMKNLGLNKGQIIKLNCFK